MRWDDVRVLLVLFRARSLEEAARRLGVDQSTVSRRVAALERALGATLFRRTREGLRPTAAADRLRREAERMEEAATALAGAAAVEQRVAGPVRLATTEPLASLLVAQGLLQVRQQHPELCIELLAGNPSLDVARGEADLALRVAPLRQAALRVRCVARLPIGLFASPGYLAGRGRPRSALELRGHDVLLPGGELARLPEAAWLAARPEVRVALRSSSMTALVAAAVAGHGIVPLAAPWGEREAGLEQVLALEDLPRRPLWLVAPPEDESRAAVRVVRDRIAAICAGALGPRGPSREAR